MLRYVGRGWEGYEPNSSPLPRPTSPRPPPTTCCRKSREVRGLGKNQLRYFSDTLSNIKPVENLPEGERADKCYFLLLIT